MLERAKTHKIPITFDALRLNLRSRLRRKRISKAQRASMTALMKSSLIFKSGRAKISRTRIAKKIAAIAQERKPRL